MDQVIHTRATEMIDIFLSRGHKLEDIAMGVSHEHKMLYSDTLKAVANEMLTNNIRSENYGSDN